MTDLNLMLVSLSILALVVSVLYNTASIRRLQRQLDEIKTHRMMP